MNRAEFLRWLSDPIRPTNVMGVMNVTPDSFSDGGEHLSPTRAVEAARQMAADGAVILDLGAESTRPGSEPVNADEQLRRLLPVLEGLPTDLPAVLSIDTTSGSVLAGCVAATRRRGGPEIVLANDVSAGTADPEMLPTVAKLGLGVCLMHMRGTPATMQGLADYSKAAGGVVGEVKRYLMERVIEATAAGIMPEGILIDPGIGFAKTTADNLKLLAALPEFVALGKPVLVGASRKRFLGEICSREQPKERLAASLSVAVFAASNAAAVVRVHDVAATADALRVLRAIDRARLAAS